MEEPILKKSKSIEDLFSAEQLKEIHGKLTATENDDITAEEKKTNIISIIHYMKGINKLTLSKIRLYITSKLKQNKDPTKLTRNVRNLIKIVNDNCADDTKREKDEIKMVKRMTEDIQGMYKNLQFNSTRNLFINDVNKLLNTLLYDSVNVPEIPAPDCPKNDNPNDTFLDFDFASEFASPVMDESLIDLINRDEINRDEQQHDNFDIEWYIKK